jgi:RNA-binding protein Nova
MEEADENDGTSLLSPSEQQRLQLSSLGSIEKIERPKAYSQQHHISTIPEEYDASMVEPRVTPPPQPTSTTSGSATTPTSSTITTATTSPLPSGGGGEDSAQRPELSQTQFSATPLHLLAEESGPPTQSWTPSHSSARNPHRSDPSVEGATPPSSSAPEPIQAAIKMLVSNNAAGSIIGRQGQSISELQLESNTRIKFSQSNDFYPGTQDRVCLVQGSVPAVKLAIQLLLQRFYQIQQSENQHAFNTAPAMASSQWHLHASGIDHNAYRIGGPMTASGAGGFDFVVRLLVPATCCGMIIGKSGANIKYMEEQTGVSSIRLSSKEESILLAPTNERIVTITGMTVDQCVQCVYIVIDGMMAHPDISHYTNMTTSYANCGMSIASTLLLGEAALRKPPQMSQPSQHVIYPMSSSAPIMMHHHPRIEHISHSQHQQHWGESMGSNSFASGTPGLNLSSGMDRRIASSPDLPRGTASVGHHPASGVNVYATGSANTAASPPYSPLQQSHSHDPLPSPPLIPSQGPFHLVAQSFPFQDASVPETMTNSSERRPHVVYPQPGQLQPEIVAHSTSAPNLLAMQLEETLFVSPRHTEPAPPSPAAVPALSPRAHAFPPQNEDYAASISTEATTTGATALALQMPTMIAPGCFTAQVLVPSTLVGSILGRGGRTLVDLQMMSGTNIRISQRNEYMPGTRSRIVTIRGPNTHSVWQAQYLISQRMTMVAPTTTFASVHSVSAPQPPTCVTAASSADAHHHTIASSSFSSRNEHSRLSIAVDTTPTAGTETSVEQEQQR